MIIEKFKRDKATLVEEFSDVTIFFSDIVSFTEMSSTKTPIQLVSLLNDLFSVLSMDEQTLLREAKSLNREKIMALIRQSGLIQGILHVLLLSTSAHITRELGMAPGGEFRAAHVGSLQVPNCRVVLGDRPLQITLQR